MADFLDELFNIIDRKRGSYLAVLKEAISIKSVNGDQSETGKILSWAENKLRDLGASTTLEDAGSININGKTEKLPPILIANIKSKSKTSTLLVYGHLDVRSSFDKNKNEYELVEENGVLFGKGVTDSKGPLLCWFNAIQAYVDKGGDPPINIRFVIEAMKERGSIGLMEYLYSSKGSLFNNVDYICISDSSCLFNPKPVLTFGLRGCCKFRVTVKGGKLDLHSGVHGGMVAEPMTDLISLLCSLTNSQGDILIPNINDNVQDVTPEEEKAYHRLSFDVPGFKTSYGISKLLHKEDKKRLLMHKSRFPSLTIHGISTGEETDEDAIPCKVVGTFSIRTVPNQSPEEMFNKVQVYLMFIFNKTHSPNSLTIEMTEAIPPWIANTTDNNYKAATKAIYKVYKQEPELIREGSSIPIVGTLQKVSGKSVLLLPVGCSEHYILKNRDRMDVKTFMDGTKVVATYLYELSLLKKDKTKK